MIIKPKTRGFICTTAHPGGCAEGVRRQIEYARANAVPGGPERVLVIGSSTGYGLASRIAAAFACRAATVGVFFERPSSGARTATPGWYNNLAFERAARESGLVAESVNGDAFSDGIKEQVVRLIQERMPGGQVDLVIYSIAAPKREDPDTGTVHRSAIKPIGAPFSGKTVDFHTGEVSLATIEPADGEEIEGTVAVMGGADWLRWARALSDAGMLAPRAATLAYSYIGPEVTHPIYRDGTIGRAKADLEEKAGQISALLAPGGGRAFVSVNKALVTQASAAIPVVPLYMSLLFRVMKENGTHEGCIEQAVRLFGELLYPEGMPADWSRTRTDDAGRIRLDDRELSPETQRAVSALWETASTENIDRISDIAGYRSDFFRLFGFGFEGIDYEADTAEY